VGAGLTIDGSGVLQAAAGSYTLPIATNIVLGGVKRGSGLDITADGTLSVPDDRVLRAGDTMTGALAVRPPADEDGVSVWGAATSGKAAFALRSKDGTQWLGGLSAIDTAYMALRMPGTLSIEPAGGGVYQYTDAAVFFNRRLELKPEGNFAALDVRPNGDGLCLISYINTAGTVWHGDIKAADNNFFSISVPGHLTLAAAETNGNAYVLIRGGWSSASPIVFAAASNNIAAIGPAGDYLKWSDAAAKNSIRTIDYGLAQVLQLRPVAFKFNHLGDNARESLGFIAQEVEEVIPEAVIELPGDAGSLGLTDSALIPVLVKAIQELTARIEALEAP
jgi:hypothetical protein